MEVGLGCMGLDQDVFWAQSLREWDARQAGFVKMHGGGKDDAAVTPLTMSELDALIEEYPDGEPLPGMDHIHR